MKQELIDIITRMKQDPTRLLSVIDTDTYQSVVNSWSAARICEKYGSVEGFFNTLVESGTKNIAVQERKKQGNTTIALSDKKVFSLVPHSQMEPTQSVLSAPKSPTILPAQPPVMTMGVNGLAGFGLGVPQLIDLHVSAHEKVRLDTENKFLKDENQRLKKEVEELKEERLQTKFSEAKAKGNNEMLMGLLQHAPALMSVFKGTHIPMEGLAGVEPPAAIPPEKQVLFDQFANTSPNVDGYMSVVLSGIMTNENFYNELSLLLKKYEFIKD